ncbi:MAG TPA: glycerate kinase, partial [Verrucomicrobiae bacterium]|nr:glycerate kinase [Verrucomicrobiae bacterium]
ISGIVITRYGHGGACRDVEVVEAAHPVSDEAGIAATKAMIARLDNLSADDLVLCLMSGGGSALMVSPAPGVSLADKQAVTKALLKSGAPIAAINCVRKHLSAIKGGRLAMLAQPATLLTLAISDVPGDDPALIASGPTIADPSTRADALEILDRYAIEASASVRAWLNDPASETPKVVSEKSTYIVVASARQALEAAAEVAHANGIQPYILGDAIEGEARAVGTEHAALVRDILAGRGPVQAPCVLISGGETTVTVRGAGRGGRNSEYLLALGIALDGAEGVYALAADTDGIDGVEDNAGAVIGPDLLARAHTANLNAADHLANNDAYSLFRELDALVVTGPTRTNVNDFRAILIAPTMPKETP